MTLDGAIAACGNSRNWPTHPMRDLVKRTKDLGYPDLPLLGVSLAEGVRPRADDDGRPAASLDLSGYKRVREGDIIMNALGKPHGSIGRSPQEGITSPAYWVMETSTLADSRFLHYLLRSEHMVNEYQRLGKYLPPNQFDISWDSFRDIEIPLPPVEEQRRIADFLDDQVARIDKLINAHERLRYLSSEQFESERHAWVSGSDPRGTSDLAGETPLQWIESPALGWQTTRLAAHFNFRKGRDSQRLTKEFITAHPGPYPVYSGQTANDGVFGFLDTYDFDLGQGAILIATVGSVATIGTRMVSGKCSLSQNCALIIPRVGVTNAQVRFTEYQLKSILQVRLSEVPQHMQTSLRLADLAGYRLVLPDPSRVSRIVDELDRRAAWCATVAVECGTAIARLEERKRALITEAVTGELDVTTAKPIGMGKWVPHVGAGVDAPVVSQASSIGGIG